MLRPDYADAWFNLGNVYRELNDQPSAIQAYQEALFVKPDYQNVWNNLGNVYVGQSNWDEAISAYKQSLKISENEQTRNNLAYVLKVSGKELD